MSNRVQDQLSFRLARDADIGQLVQLLRDAEWGDVDEATWRSWYREAPTGPSTIAVAEDSTGSIVGQLELRPSRVWTPQGEIRAGRLSSVVLSPHLRSPRWRGADHPLYGMYVSVLEAAHDMGLHLVHALPHRVVLVAIASAGKPAHHFRCLGADLESIEPEATACPVERAGDIGDEFDDLWERGRTNLPVEFGVVRDAQRVAAGCAGHELLTSRDGEGGLLAYGIVRRTDGLLLDVFGASLDSLSAFLHGMLRQAAVWHADGQFRPKTLTAMETPHLAPVFSAAGFTPVNYRFGGFVHRVSDSVPAGLDDLGRWHLTGGD